jgi:N-acetylneuraminate synthase
MWGNMSEGDEVNRIKLGERWVGEGEPCFIIAEAGSNHNGLLEQAYRLIDAAVEAGVDAVKFQNFKASKLYPASAGKSDYLGSSRSIYEIIHEMEMPEDWVPRLASYCGERDLEFLSSPFDEASADLLEPYVAAFKVASYELTHIPLLRHIARKGKPVIMSTGTADLEEVLHSVEVVRGEGDNQIILLQCTASYPAPLDAVNARALIVLNQVTGCPTGLSDHSRDPIVAPIVAVSLGACVIEKHFTLSNALPGPDHKFAVEPHELKDLVRRVRQAEQILGHGRKEVLPVEQELRAFARRSIFAVKAIQTGKELTRENVAVLRCGKLGFGLAPEDFEKVLGRMARRDISAETLIQWDDLV